MTDQSKGGVDPGAPDDCGPLHYAARHLAATAIVRALVAWEILSDDTALPAVRAARISSVLGAAAADGFQTGIILSRNNSWPINGKAVAILDHFDRLVEEAQRLLTEGAEKIEGDWRSILMPPTGA